MKMIPALIAAFFILGCTHIDPIRTGSIDVCADRLARGLSKGLEETYMGMNILVSTPVDAVTFVPSDFGLALQEFIISALAHRKINVLEVQLRKEPYMNCEQGLVSLSRDASRLRPEFHADVVVVGTYLVTKEDVVVTARAIDFTTNEVITSATTTLTRTSKIDNLLRNRDQAKLYEK